MKFNSDDLSHANYLHLRRQLGSQENGDVGPLFWSERGGKGQHDIITVLIARCEKLLENRDLSWGNYCRLHRSLDRREFNPVTWDDAPLFIKAAIIPQESNWAGEQLYHEREDDTPESEVVAW